MQISAISAFNAQNPAGGTTPIAVPAKPEKKTTVSSPNFEGLGTVSGGKIMKGLALAGMLSMAVAMITGCQPTTGSDTDPVPTPTPTEPTAPVNPTEPTNPVVDSAAVFRQNIADIAALLKSNVSTKDSDLSVAGSYQPVSGDLLSFTMVTNTDDGLNQALNAFLTGKSTLNTANSSKLSYSFDSTDSAGNVFANWATVTPADNGFRLDLTDAAIQAINKTIDEGSDPIHSMVLKFNKSQGGVVITMGYDGMEMPTGVVKADEKGNLCEYDENGNKVSEDSYNGTILSSVTFAK